MAEKVVVPYEHDSQDLTSIWIAVTNGAPREADWKPAYRDTIDGRLVVWVKYPTIPSGSVWVKDRLGQQRHDRTTGPASRLPPRGPSRRRR